MYQVGSLIILRDDDPKFSNYMDAYNYAINASIDDSVYGIWDADANLLGIVYQGELFEK